MYVGMAIMEGVAGAVLASNTVGDCQHKVMSEFQRRAGLNVQPASVDHLFVVYIGPSMQEERRWVFFTDTQQWTEV